MPLVAPNKYRLRQVGSMPQAVPIKYHWRHGGSMPQVVQSTCHLRRVVGIPQVVPNKYHVSHFVSMAQVVPHMYHLSCVDLSWKKCFSCSVKLVFENRACSTAIPRLFAPRPRRGRPGGPLLRRSGGDADEEQRRRVRAGPDLGGGRCIG